MLIFKMKKSLVFLIFLVANVYSQNVIVEWIKSAVDFNLDPCDDFYRHACPLNISRKLELQSIIDSVYKNLKQTTLPKIDDILTGKIVELNKNVETLFSRMKLEYEQKCNTDRKSANEFLSFLEKTVSPTGKCQETYCLSTIAKDDDCSRAASTLVAAIITIMNDQKVTTKLLSKAMMLTTYRQTSYVVNSDAEHFGAATIQDLIDDIKALTVKRIKKTPWIINSQSTESYKHVVRSLEFIDNLDESFKSLESDVLKLTNNYTECMKSFQQEKFTGQVICLLKMSKMQIKDIELRSAFNAENRHPYLYASVPLYFMPLILSDYSALMGFVGQVMAHEVGHSVFESPGLDNLMPYYSQDTIDCVQGQFNSTCDYFKEKSCGAHNSQIDENGADMFANRIAYDLMAEHYGDSLTDQIPGLNITQQQLYFYSLAFTQCLGQPSEQRIESDGSIGEHSPKNIRTNVLANLPEFHQAFRCSASSRMFRSASKECIIVGENANNMRKL